MPSPRHVKAVGCDVAAQGFVRASAGELAALRRSPGAPGDVPPPPSLLKHADEQTVVALAAVLRAAREGGLDPNGFGDWGVVSAPRYLGRAAFEGAFPQFLAEGVWGVSPLLIANHSLHAPSGTVSQVLKAYGPNLGVGGVPGHEDEAFLAAASMLDGGAAPGVWVVLTGWAPGPFPPPGLLAGSGVDAEGGDARVCEGVALALVPSRAGWSGPRLRVRPGGVTVVSPEPGVEALSAWLDTGGGATRWRRDGIHPPAAAPRRSGSRVAGAEAKHES